MLTKTLLYIQLLLLLIVSTSNAQLAINNSAYVYASDTPIFITEDLNLITTDAKFYLRNDAQLLQGNETTNNEGVGQLSVYQTGTVNQWAYNYWCSPVGNTDTNTTVNNAFRGNNQFYHVTAAPITSSPVSFTTNSDGSSSASNLVVSSKWIYSYNPGSTYSEWDHKGDTGSIDSGYGFCMKGIGTGSSGNQLYDFRGKPNSGTIDINVLSSQFTLTGNPYPSAIDSALLLNDSDNTGVINGTLYFWEQDQTIQSHYLSSYSGGYASFTITSGGFRTYIPAVFNTYKEDGTINTTGSSSSSGKVVRRYIPFGQGFMVRGSAGGTLKLKNAHRVYYKQSDGDSEFFRVMNFTGKAQQKKSTLSNEDFDFEVIPEGYMRFRLNVDFNGIYTRQLVQTFHESATNGFDYGMEIVSPGGPESDAFWPFEDEKMLAQAFNFNTDLRLPLGMTLSEDQSITLRLIETENFEDNTVYVFDKATQEYHNITTTPFIIYLKKGDYVDRFEITFKDDSILNVTDTITNENDIKIYQKNNLKTLLISNPKKQKITSVTLIDNLGRSVFSKTINSKNSTQQIDILHLSSGIYSVKVSGTNTLLRSEKIIVK